MIQRFETEALTDAELDSVHAGGLLEPVIARRPKNDLVSYREEFGVERPKNDLFSIEGIEYGKPKFNL